MKFLVPVVLFFLSVSFCYAQQTGERNDTIYRIKLNSGNYIEGKYAGTEGNYMVIEKTEIGVIRISMDSIQSFEKKIITYKNNKVWFDNFYTDHYFLVPGAIPLAKGEAQLTYTEGIFGGMRYGISKNITASISTFLLLPGFYANFGSLKAGFKVNEYVHAGGGVLAGFSPLLELYNNSSFEDNPAYLAGYGNVTLGNKSNNLTLGGGYGLISNDGRIAMGFGGGMIRLSRRLYLVAEDWLVYAKYKDEYYNYYSYSSSYTDREETENYFLLGLRVTGKRLCFEYGYGFFSGNRYGFPYINLCIRLNKK